MLNILVSGKTRLKLLTKFFLVPEVRGHLRGLAQEFGDSTNAIRLELNRFEKGGLLLSEMVQNRKVFRANSNHPLFADIASILRKHTGIDQLVARVVDQIGNVTRAYITGDMAVGRNTPRIDLVLVGSDISLENLDRLTAKAEKLIGREISWVILSPDEAVKTIDGRNDVWKIWGE